VEIALKSLISLGCARTTATRTTDKPPTVQKGQMEAES